MVTTPALAPRRNKYGARRVVLDGEAFDSKKELRRWQDLRLLERGGVIGDLRRQVPFKFVVNGQPLVYDTGRAVTYVADAVYTENGVFVVEDVKSPPTRARTDYRLKKALMLTCHGVAVREV